MLSTLASSFFATLLALGGLFGLHHGAVTPPASQSASVAVAVASTAGDSSPVGGGVSSGASAHIADSPIDPTPSSLVPHPSNLTPPPTTYVSITNPVRGFGELGLIQSLAQQMDALAAIVHAQQHPPAFPQQVAGAGITGPALGGYVLGPAVGNSSSGGSAAPSSVAASTITGTITNVINSASAAIASLTGTDLVYTNATATNATSTNLFAQHLAAGDASLATTSIAGDLSVSGTTTSRSLRVSSLDCSSFGNGGKLTTDAFGDVVCATDQGGAGGTVAGTNSQVQFNNGGSFGASASFTFATTSTRLTVTNASTTAFSSSYASSTDLRAGTLSLSGLAQNALLIGGANGAVAQVATSSLGLPTFADLSGYFSLAAWYATTTDGLREGASNLYFTTGRANTNFANNLAATTTTALAEGSNLYYTPNRVASVIAGTTTTALAEGSNLYFTTARATSTFIGNLAATSSVASITTLPSLSLPYAQLTGTPNLAQYFTLASWYATTTDALAQGSTNKYYSDSLVNAYIHASTTIPKAYTANAFTALQTFGNASTTNLSASYASSTQGFFGTLSLSNALSIANGGTGTSTAPSYGKLLLGNAAGSYDLVATSSLGISGGGGSSAWGAITGTLSNQSDLQTALDGKFSLAGWYGTTTTALAEGQNLYFTTARATTSFVGNLAATSSVASITALPNLGSVATSLSGFIKATSGVLSTALVDLASNVTGILPVGNGGTGWGNLASGAVVLGNGSGAVSTTTRGNLTETGSSILTITGGTNSILGSGTSIQVQQADGTHSGFLSSGDWVTFNGKQAALGYTPANQTTAVNTTYPLQGGGDLSASRTLTLAFGTTTSNTWAGTQTFTNTIAGSVTGTAANVTGTVAVANGGTGSTTLSSTLLLGNGTGGVQSYSGATCTNQFLRSLNGAGVGTCASINLASDVTGTLPILNGGTGTSTQVTNGIAYFDGTKITSGTGLVFSGGNVGIGTTSPFSLLSVAGNGFFAGTLQTADLITKGPYVDVRAYGAKCDGATDDTAAIQAAINATPSGGMLELPVGSCLVSGSGSQIFTIVNPINIVGQGASNTAFTPYMYGSSIELASSVPTTRDVFHVVGVTNNVRRGYSFRDFNVIPQSGTVGQHIFNFDSSAGTTTGFAEVVIDRIYMAQNASAGGYSIYVNNGNGNNNGAGGTGGSGSANGGLFNFTVENSYLGGGIDFIYAGDSLRVLNNLISTANAAVVLNQVAGAGNFVMSGNNVVATAGSVLVSQAVAPVIENNEFEQEYTNTEANNAMIDLTGSLGNISSAKVVNNQVQANTGTGNPTLIRVATATGTVIDGNRIATPSTYVPVIITAAASNTVIGELNTFLAGGTNWSDSGSNTTLPLRTIVHATTTGIGIRTSSPWADLTVQAASGNTSQVVLQNSDFAAGSSGSGLFMGTAASSGATYAQLFAFKSGNTAYGNIIIPGGNVGIGTTSPYQLLAVNGNIVSQNLLLQGDGSDGYIRPLNSGSRLFLGSNNTTRLTIASNGALTFNAYGAGTLTTDASGNVTASSDERLKYVMGNYASSSLDAILHVNPILYRWKDISGMDTTTVYAGFSAQNVQQAIPEAVGIDSRGYLTLSDRPILATLVNAIKEIATITGAFKANLIAWLGDASNGITDLFATHIHATADVTAPRFCVADGPADLSPLCLTKPQLAALLSQVGAAANPNSMTSGSTSQLTETGNQLTQNGTATLTLNGNDPITWPLNAPWQDNLGALFTHDGTSETVYSTSTIDTSIAGTTTIDYWATWYPDPSATTSAQALHTARQVVIEAPAHDTPLAVSEASTATSTPATQ